MRALFVTSAFVGLALAAGYFLSRETRQDSIPIAKVQYEIPKAITRVYQEPRTVGLRNKISRDCQRLWSEVSLLDLDSKFVPPTPGSCSGLPAPLDAYHFLYVEHCKKKDATCLSALHQYRAQITHFTTRDSDLSTIRDPKVLFDKLMATFERSPADAARIADRIIELDPDNYPAHKAALLATLLTSQNAKGNPNHPVWESVLGRLEIIQKMETTDEASQAEIEIFVTAIRDNNAERVLERASEMESRFPRAGFIPYMKAWAENEKGNRAGALSYLNEALSRAPDNSYYQKTWQRFQEPGLGKLQEVFFMHQSFPLMPR